MNIPWATWCLFVACMIGAPTSTTFTLRAQETPGNGVLINPLNRPVSVAVQPKAVGQSGERRFDLAPQSRLELQRYTDYSIYMLNESDVYDLNVAHSSQNGSPTRHFYYLADEQGRAIIKRGLPELLFSEARLAAEQSADRVKNRWTIQDPVQCKALSPNLHRRLLLEEYARLIGKQTGIDIVPVISGEELLLVLVTCDEQQLQLAGDRIKAQLESLPPVPSAAILTPRVVSICCTNPAVDFSTILELTRSTPAVPSDPPSISYDGGSGYMGLGKFQGLDESESDLDSLAREVRRLDHLLRNPSFNFLAPWQTQLTQCLNLQACLLANPQSLSQEELFLLRSGLTERLYQLYACALLNRNGTTSNSKWVVGGGDFQPQALNISCELDSNGKIKKFIKPTNNYASIARQFTSFNITVVLKDIDEVKVRGSGWCMLEKKKGVPFADKWEVVSPGPDSYNWMSSKYCVQVKRGNQVKVFEAFFEPRANKTWVFSFDRWETQ